MTPENQKGLVMTLVAAVCLAACAMFHTIEQPVFSVLAGLTGLLAAWST